MTPLVTAAVLLAAVTHAGWNAIAHQITDKLVGFTLIAGGGMLIGLAMIPFTAAPAADAWPYLLASACVHIAYYALLMKSFRLGDFGQAYPIARGTAPLVVTVLAALFAHEVPDGWAAAGIALSCAGLAGVALWGLRGRRPNWPAIGAASATGLTIAAYTVVDGLGVRASGSSLGYIAWLMAVQGVVIPAYALHRWRGEFAAVLRPFAGVGLLGAALSVAAYGLVLWAQTRAELAPVAALRESSIIVGAAIGAVFFKERFGAPRIAAAGLLVVGIGLMLHAG
ncbi:drug/metabolite transporter (DMT)-like permease [Streptomyces sp. SAI-208]|uniref:EamA family transporter n=1 Tax=unclassified Streptomyces TaxID=2593676 RepID=UPI002474530F|nr:MULTISPECIES: EamA family transporter [unclassified Streptomyces]MDH6518483.1 drug/metabolite transporter (DMT)-like permease [Streptomyces sp. SAI-090]MDH6550700.1 drug/metabolite transporter (DMT)-like permease [Streptomyces sp. SAI-041]MDH6569764.1 drug/metabolite transporter (DMT)-like permease [Streptomyces sp. SAI-117]MDH6609328.1 drug/metabolite transporter (DMT)-like permease [Streptomyces sp. SAI-208]MDH6617425.1 drug/metabolite transporter (DMT)-like permease [Streptomyces sp. SAI